MRETPEHLHWNRPVEPDPTAPTTLQPPEEKPPEAEKPPAPQPEPVPGANGERSGRS